MTSDLCALTATELVDAFRKKTLSPVEVAAAVLKRIEASSGLQRIQSVSERSG
jgi:Asp-tRNA(Asn)/Glu-tRNA(Gln) amidotransferase A subunit family amidase